VGPATEVSQLVPGTLIADNFTALVAGAAHACAVTDTSTLVCWGDNSSNQLTGSNNPAVVTVPNGWITVAAGAEHTCGLRSAPLPKLFCWGDNRYGQLGLGHRDPMVGPQEVPGDDWFSVFAGEHHTCAMAGGILFCWGKNDEGQVGDGSAWRAAWQTVR
jgi:alpha-tubulin suppressor-like RCC1 family protein